MQTMNLPRAVLLLSVCVSALCTTFPADFEMYEGANEETYFRVKVDGSNFLRSEGYKAPASALNGMGSVQVNGLDTTNYKVLTRVDERYYFVLKAQNHRVIAVSSGSFETLAAAEARVQILVASLRATLRLEQAVYVSEGCDLPFPRFDLLKSKNGKRHFHVKLSADEKNGFAHNLANEDAARDSIVDVIAVGNKKAAYLPFTNKVGKVFFRLLRPQGQPPKELVISQMYNTAAERTAARNALHSALRAMAHRVMLKRLAIL